MTDPEAGTSTSAALDGMVAHGLAESLAGAELAFVTLEFGTQSPLEVLTALRGDNWLYQSGDTNGPLRTAIKQDIRAAFYPERDDWKRSVWARGRTVVELAIIGMREM